MASSLKRTVLVRAVPDSFADCLVAEGVAPGSISVRRAREQHAAYVDAIRSLPCAPDVVVLQKLDDFPDSVFIEDNAVLLSAARESFLLPGSAAVSRVGEAAATLRDLLARRYTCCELGIALDGGDVLRIGDRDVIVGVSSRTGADAVAHLSRLMLGVGTQVTGVPVGRSLHLKTVVTWVSTEQPAAGQRLPRGFLVAPETGEGREAVSGIVGASSELAARGMGECVCWLPAADAYASNTLQVGDPGSTVIMPSGYDAAVGSVRRMLELHGCGGTAIITLDMSEFKLANGGKACCFSCYLPGRLRRIAL
jgi:dimethylargininase